MEIDAAAFRGCAQLTNVQLNQGLQFIRADVFTKTSISQVSIPASVVRVEQSAFADCPRLSAVYFPRQSQLQVVGPKAFINTPLRSVVLPPNTKWMPDSFNGNVQIITK